MRNRLDHQLLSLHDSLIHMGTLCEEGINAGVEALLTENSALAQHAIQCEQRIDQCERDIENLCMKLLLQQQPVARDLRAISSALKMISDMERIGDQAADIAEIISHMDTAAVSTAEQIGAMAQAAAKMVTDSVNSFVKKDLNMAQSVIQYDDVVDRGFLTVREELVVLLRSNSSAASKALDLLMIAKYLERIGDHAVNIAQWVIYAITGAYPKPWCFGTQKEE